MRAPWNVEWYREEWKVNVPEADHLQGGKKQTDRLELMTPHRLARSGVTNSNLFSKMKFSIVCYIPKVDQMTISTIIRRVATYPYIFL